MSRGRNLIRDLSTTVQHYGENKEEKYKKEILLENRTFIVAIFLIKHNLLIIFLTIRLRIYTYLIYINSWELEL